jgi:membrane-associated HD superfamily phosphohydrolase
MYVGVPYAFNKTKLTYKKKKKNPQNQKHTLLILYPSLSIIALYLHRIRSASNVSIGIYQS